MNRTILTIGAFDPSCADGVAADIKTCAAYRCYCVGVVTTLTAQNSQGIQAVQPVPMEFVGQQMESLGADMKVHAAKTGLLGTATSIEIVASLVKSYSLSHLVVDPEMEAALTGAPLIDDNGIAALKQHLFPLADLVTPNLHEASLLSGIEVNDVPSMREAAQFIHEEFGPKAVIIKGGHLGGSRAMDVLYDGQRHSVHDAARIASENNRGLGTTFATALAIQMTRGIALGEAINKAKQYLQKAMSHPFTLTDGPGPLNHAIPV
jgi:hydroxymethylpyrimidine/phosphomethylpyrimidine kinase